MLTDAFKRRPTAYRTIDLTERAGVSGRLVHGDYDPETETVTIGLATEDGNVRFTPSERLIEQIEAAFGPTDPEVGGTLSVNNLGHSASGERMWSAHWEPPVTVDPEPVVDAFAPELEDASTEPAPADDTPTPEYQIPVGVFGDDGAGVDASQDVGLTSAAPRPRPRPQPHT
jgi:hypothetical protein